MYSFAGALVAAFAAALLWRVLKLAFKIVLLVVAAAAGGVCAHQWLLEHHSVVDAPRAPR